MKLLCLELRNFKGLKQFTLEPNGENAEVRGCNASGKTTLADALHWLLFDKDSQGAKQFEIKTLDASGEPAHGLEHCVEGTFDLGGDSLTLKKVYKEKWTRRRGQAEQELTGHTTEYFIDGVPTPAREYQARVQELAPEDLFRLLTNPLYFSEGMHWQDRRRILLDVCGDISDADVIASNPELAPLEAILGKRSLDDHKKVVLAERKRVNEQLEKLPVRIDEVSRVLPTAADGSMDEIDKAVADIETLLSAKRADLSRLENGGESAELTKRLREVEGEIQALRNEQRKRQDQIDAEWRDGIRAQQDRLNEMDSRVKSLDREISQHSALLERQSKAREHLLNEWHKEDGMKFRAPEQASVCPACGQDIPAERLESALAKALEEFNLSKSTKLERISAEGKEVAAAMKSLEAELEQYRAERVKLVPQAEALRAEIKRAQAEVRPGAPIPDGFAPLEAEMASLQAKIEAAKLGISDQVEAAFDEIKCLEETQKGWLDRRSDIRRLADGRKRINELMAEEKNLAKEFERLEHDLYLCEQFLRAKVSMLESSINIRFHVVRFKLFSQQVNGGLAETCEMTVNGVPYASLNRAAKLQGGMDIINVLAQHHGFYPPVFLDNRESVTEIPPTESQLINLYVDPGYPKLEAQVVPAASRKAA